MLGCVNASMSSYSNVSSDTGRMTPEDINPEEDIIDFPPKHALCALGKCLLH
jgi:hypothetical protein